MKLSWPLIQALLFYIMWYLAVLSAAQPGGEIFSLLTQGVFVALGLFMRKRAITFELKFLLLLTVVGSLIDMLPVRIEFTTFPYTQYFIGVYPVWMVGMWCCFATIFSTGLSWMRDKISWQIFFGFLGGPLSLFAAQRIGAVDFPKDFAFTMLLYAFEWAFIMAIAFGIYKYLAARTHDAGAR